MTCQHCNQSLSEGGVVRAEPVRHLTSPNSINYDRSRLGSPNITLVYCSVACQKEDAHLTYAFWADLDRNASDSECFVHEGWEGKVRVGHCSITGERVMVEPMQPGLGSRQPRACYEHFKLHPRYQQYFNRLPIAQHGKAPINH